MIYKDVKYGFVDNVTVAEFGEGAQHFASKADLLLALNQAVTPQTQVLVKGSRFMRMEDIVNALEGVQPCC